MTQPQRHRITAELTEEQAKILNNALPHGMRKPLFQAVVEGIIEIYNQGGYEALGAIISKYISVQQISEAGLKAKKKETIKELEEHIRSLKK